MVLFEKGRKMELWRPEISKETGLSVCRLAREVSLRVREARKAFSGGFEFFLVRHNTNGFYNKKQNKFF